MNSKIDLFIAGAQKCGTTSLKNYLGEHPQINAQFHTEMTYFTDDGEFAAGYATAKLKYFANPKPREMARVGKYVSLSRHEVGLRRLHAHNPAVKIVFMVRNPVQRSFSSFLMEQSVGGETRPFDRAIEDALADPDTWQYRAYIGYGFYIEDIRRILKYFGRRQLRIVALEDLNANPQRVLAEIFEWLGVDSHFIPNVAKVHNQGGRQRSRAYNRLLRWLLDESNALKRFARSVLPPQATTRLGVALRQINKQPRADIAMPEETRRFLSRLYEPYNLALAEFIDGSELPWQ